VTQRSIPPGEVLVTLSRDPESVASVVGLTLRGLTDAHSPMVVGYVRRNHMFYKLQGLHRGHMFTRGRFNIAEVINSMRDVNLKYLFVDMVTLATLDIGALPVIVFQDAAVRAIPTVRCTLLYVISRNRDRRGLPPPRGRSSIGL
jgi:hypothetical protein